MTDDQDFVREEEALRAALQRRAQAYEPTPMTAPSRARGRRPALLAAAAVLVIVAGLGGIAASIRTLAGDGDSVASADRGQSRAAVEPGLLADSPGTTAGRTAPASGLPDLGPDRRWAVRDGIAFAVPASWRDAAPPRQPECIRRPGDRWDDAPRTPYVATQQQGPIAGPACSPVRTSVPEQFGRLPFRLWRPYVQVTDKQPEGSWTYRGWNLLRMDYGGRTVSILSAPGSGDTGYDIKASLRRTSVDDNGCATGSPLPAGAPVRPARKPAVSPLTGSVSTIAICRYSPAQGTLTGGRLLTGAAARSLVRAITHAPAGSGPNTPRNCATGVTPASYVLLHVSGDHPGDVYVSYDLCDAHGFYDGRSVHRLTAAACRPVFARPPVTLTSGQADVMRLCGTRD